MCNKSGGHKSEAEEKKRKEKTYNRRHVGKSYPSIGIEDEREGKTPSGFDVFLFLYSLHVPRCDLQIGFTGVYSLEPILNCDHFLFRRCKLSSETSWEREIGEPDVVYHGNKLQLESFRPRNPQTR